MKTAFTAARFGSGLSFVRSFLRSLVRHFDPLGIKHESLKGGVELTSLAGFTFHRTGAVSFFVLLVGEPAELLVGVSLRVSSASGMSVLDGFAHWRCFLRSL